MDHVQSQTTKIIGFVPASEMKSNAARFFAGDVLYGRLRPYLNKVTQPTFDGLASAEFMVFRDTELIRSSFLKYRLNAADFVSFASHLNEGDRPRVGFDQIGKFELLVPPPAEQERIVGKLEELFSELDSGIESLTTVREQLKAYRQAVLKHAFEGRMTGQWRNDNTTKVESADQLLIRIKKHRDAEYQKQLKEWKVLADRGERVPKPRPPNYAVPFSEEEKEGLVLTAGQLEMDKAWRSVWCVCRCNAESQELPLLGWQHKLGKQWGSPIPTNKCDTRNNFTRRIGEYVYRMPSRRHCHACNDWGGEDTGAGCNFANYRLPQSEYSSNSR